MVPVIKKIDLDGLELLPDIIETPLWSAIDPDRTFHSKKSDRQLAGLYRAIQKRENYFQTNDPTAFGNPQFSFYAGEVCGFLQAMDADEYIEGEQIVIRRNDDNKKLLVIDKPKRPKHYYDALKGNKETLAAFGV